MIVLFSAMLFVLQPLFV